MRLFPGSPWHIQKPLLLIQKADMNEKKPPPKQAAVLLFH
jgi:hypothetical protein